MNRKIELWLCALLTFPVLLLSYFANLPRAAAESTPNENEVVSTHLDDYIDSEPIKIDEAAAAVNERSMGNTSFMGGEENSHIGGITEAVTLGETMRL